MPTRVTDKSHTLIDNILISPPKSCNVKCGNLTIGISDHLPQFIIFNKLSTTPVIPSENFYKDWKSFDHEIFRRGFAISDWDKVLSFNEEDVNESFVRFYEEISKLIDKSLPTKKVTKRQREMKSKPWVTKRIIKSIANRNKIFKKFIKCNQQDKKTLLFKRYKLYRNEIVELIRQSKLNHYQKYFSENMKNTRRIWKGINNLIGNRKANPKEISIKINEELTSDPYTVSQHFNDYFVSIANRIRDKIPNTKQRFYEIRKKKSKAFFLFPTN